MRVYAILIFSFLLFPLLTCNDEEQGLPHFEYIFILTNELLTISFILCIQNNALEYNILYLINICVANLGNGSNCIVGSVLQSWQQAVTAQVGLW